MTLSHPFIFPLPNGLHARPASHLEAIAGRFASAVTLVDERSGASANAKSVLSMVGADVKFNDPCRLEVSGTDAESAVAALKTFLIEVFPTCDEALPQTAVNAGDTKLPRSLTKAGVGGYLSGTAVVGGIGVGRAMTVGGLELPEGLPETPSGDAAAEIDQIDGAVRKLAAVLESKVAATHNVQEADVLKAHLAIVKDVELATFLRRAVEVDGLSGPRAILSANAHYSATLRQSQSAYLRERVLDVQDVCSQLLEHLLGPAYRPPKLRLTGPSVVVADALTPGQFLALDRTHLKGLILNQGGTTSHTVILARSMNIPTVVGVTEATGRLGAGQTVVVDGSFGIVIDQPSPAVDRYYRMETAKMSAVKKRYAKTRNLPAKTADGHSLEVAANVASAEEVGPAMEAGGDGVGLFRTEMLFMDRPAAPTEDEQTEIYTRALAAAQGKPVIIRTIDIGGDKPAPYLNLSAEENPFLGFRGVRLYAEFPHLIKPQLRAILRASSAGAVKVMVPMVACVEEARMIKALLAECAAELTAQGIPVVQLPPLGIMLEVPSAVFAIDEFCREVDFFSIGSNDLTQYFLAADRANQKVTRLYSWAHPAFLRLMKKIVDDVHRNGKWVGLCGEMGDNAAALPLLVGLGLDEISLSAPRVAAVKSAVASLNLTACQALVEKAVGCATRDEVEAVVALSRAAGPAKPMLTADLILSPDCATKEEAIKTLADALQVDGRVEQSFGLEEAIWLREDTYSTGFGYGFAVPHCKTDLLSANTIAVARLKAGVEWGSLDEKPVDVVILLAIRAAEHGKEHMRIFSMLSRLVMRDEFRDRVRSEPDPATLLGFIQDSLGLSPN